MYLLIPKKLAYLTVMILVILIGAIFFIPAKNLGGKTSLPPLYPTPTLTPFPTEKPLDVMQIHRLINEYRIENGLKPLRFNESMCPFTKVRLNQIHTNWSHTGWLSVKNYYTYVYFGENLSKGYSYAEAIVSAWIASPGHLANIVKPVYTDTCIAFDEPRGVPNVENSVYVVQHFASF